jgi:hypothetical protein
VNANKNVLAVWGRGNKIGIILVYGNPRIKLNVCMNAELNECSIDIYFIELTDHIDPQKLVKQGKNGTKTLKNALT